MMNKLTTDELNALHLMDQMVREAEDHYWELLDAKSDGCLWGKSLVDVLAYDAGIEKAAATLHSREEARENYRAYLHELQEAPVEKLAALRHLDDLEDVCPGSSDYFTCPLCGYTKQMNHPCPRCGGAE